MKGNVVEQSKRKGRPSKPDAEKRQQIGVRTSPELKDLLEEAAAANGRSVAQEAEIRLLRSFEEERWLGGRRTAQVLYAVAAQIERAEAMTQKGWLDDYTTWHAARKLADKVMSDNRPTPPNVRAIVSAIKAEDEAKKTFTTLWEKYRSKWTASNKPNPLSGSTLNELALLFPDNAESDEQRREMQQDWDEVNNADLRAKQAKSAVDEAFLAADAATDEGLGLAALILTQADLRGR